MKTIWKFELMNVIEMPKGAKILSLQTQNDTPYIWALVDTDMKKEKRVFSIFGTGHPLISPYYSIKNTYIGTYQLRGFVLHVFEIIK